MAGANLHAESSPAVCLLRQCKEAHLHVCSTSRYGALLQAFYIPWGDELHRWALTHPEYTQSQILMLVTCIAESNSLKRRDRNALTTQIETDLADMR